MDELDRNVNELCGGNYLKAADLQNREHTVTISSVSFRQFPRKDGSMQTKPIIAFQGAVKTLVCNFTNRETITFLYGPVPRGWIGKPITIYPTQTQFGTGMTDCIRVKPPATAAAIGNGHQRQIAQPAQRQHVVTARPNYDLSEVRAAPQPDGLQEALGETGEEIPW